ncbi:PREDICTED: uncharacterized protein LOC108564474 [Nicrophorus vespilloides]|uniref:Uncharacterized protein LOC108564474 n=1 Tax=Nicrophorus vespilloides TaxID=110193 RepID=A0ABM1MWS5_NICVS|nr:PREDICTED: uncharacterized protein LOC108564474 [Nicrophorus vespilloides]
MHPPEFRLYCTWHVEQAWSRNLNKISSKEKRDSVEKKLKLILEETDVEAFKRTSTQYVVQLLEDQETKKFALYFQSNYMKKTETWAHCYRVNEGLNTNMHLESMHKTIKYMYLKAKHTRRLDVCIHAIQKYANDKLFDNIVMGSKGKITSKITNLRHIHKDSEKIDLGTVLIEDKGIYEVFTKSNEVFTVQENNKTCSCKIYCSICEMCMHAYSCTCRDYSIQWNMCKHVHLVQRYRKEYPESLPKSEKICSDDESDEDCGQTDITPNLVDCVSKKEKDKSCLEHKKNIIVRRTRVAMQNVSAEVLDKARKWIDLFEEECNPKQKKTAPSTSAPSTSASSTSSAPSAHNKRIIPQRRLFSTKKRIISRTEENKENLGILSFIKCCAIQTNLVLLKKTEDKELFSSIFILSL